MPATTLPARGTTAFPRQIAQAIFEDVYRTSVVQQLARRINLPASGVAIPVTTEKPKAGWVAEAARKPTTTASQAFRVMDPKKLAAIIVFSSEYVDADPSQLYANIRPQIAEAFATAFDLATIHGLAHDGTAGPFPDSIAATTKAVELGTATTGGVWADLVAGLELLVTDRKRLSGFALDPVLEPTLLGALDGNGRPLLTDAPADSGLPQRLMGRPAGYSEGVATGANDTMSTLRGIGGDFSKVAFGVGSAINYAVSEESTVTIDGALVSLWENNLVAIRAEAQYGFVAGDIDAFVKYTETPSGTV